jgi:2',3'-cyclic-nucleotide 2'-phosphodiesterase (5'-nucleotidase family)
MVVEKSDKPKGWKFMKEYVSEDGTVYHKGIEQPALYGTLPSTVIEEKPAKQKVSKKDKEEMKNALGTQIASLKAELMKETRKTKRQQLTKELNGANRQLKKLI